MIIEMLACVWYKEIELWHHSHGRFKPGPGPDLDVRSHGELFFKSRF